jgi:hypothetical protein
MGFAELFKHRDCGEQLPDPFFAFAGLALLEAMLGNRGEYGLDIVWQHVVSARHQRPGFGGPEQPEAGPGGEPIQQAWHPAALFEQPLEVIQQSRAGANLIHSYLQCL